MKWDGSSWSALGTGLNSSLASIATSGSDVYAGGKFSIAGGEVSVNIAQWKEPCSNDTVTPCITNSICSTYLTQEAIAYYPFSGEPTTPAATIHNATVIGATLTSDRFGHVNSAFNFNGSSTKIRIPDADTLDNDHSMSISLWIRPELSTPYGYIISQWFESPNFGDYILRVDDQMNGTYKVGMTLANYPEEGASGEYSGQSSSTYPWGDWQHLVMTFDSGEVKLYVNNMLEHSANVGFSCLDPMEYVNDDINIGQLYSDDPLTDYEGDIDDIRIYNTAIDALKVQSLYEENVDTLACYSCPIIVNTDPGQCTAAVTWTAPSATDNCSVSSLTQTAGLPSGSSFSIGTHTITYEAVDPSNNVTSCSFDVIVSDEEVPVASCQDITLYLDASGLALIPSEDVNNSSYDNCGVDSIAIDSDSFTCINLDDNIVVFSVFDIYGNSDTCHTTITVFDTICPVAMCQDISVYLDANGGSFYYGVGYK